MIIKGILPIIITLMASFCMSQLEIMAQTEIPANDTTPKARELTRRDFILHTYNPNTEIISMYYKDASNKLLRTLGSLKQFVESSKRELIFAMNGGMYHPDFAPVGLFIADHTMHKPVNLNSGNGNFFIQPNGVFYVDANEKPGICLARDIHKVQKIKHATQSGPMLVINRRINPYFSDTSNYFNIRNGVGITKYGKLIFAMSRKPVTLYEFAHYFKQQRCVNALYFDGSLSKTYAPRSRWTQLNGNFGVMIGVLKR
jgi:uncharacterized protein YigE (DUF2233 family)